MELKSIIKIAISLVVVAAIIFGGYFVINSVRNNKLLKEYEASYQGKPAGMTVTAHSGSMNTQQNSIEAIKVGMENAEIVEMDINFDENGVPVLSHEKPTGGEVTLDEAFAVVATGTAKVNMDLKDVNGNLDAVYETAKKYALLERVYFTGIKEEHVDTFKKANIDIPYFVNISIDKKKNTDPEHINEIISKLEASGAIGLNVNYKLASAELTKMVQDAGFKVSYWTVDNKLDMYRIMSYKPNNMSTNYPDVVNNLNK